MFNSKFFSNTFSDLFVEFFEHVRAVAPTWRFYPQANEPILQPVAELQARAVQLQPAVSNIPATLVPDSPEAGFIKLVEDCLRKYPDAIALAQSPLVDYVGVKSGNHIERGKQLQRLLYDAIESLRPTGARPGDVLPRAWYNYVVLHDAYIEGVRNYEVMARLYISEGTFHRTRRNALRGVAMCLIEGMRQREYDN